MYFKLALSNVKKSMRDYGIYFLTLVFGVCVFYAFNSITQQSTVLKMSEVQNQMLELLSLLIGGVSIFIAVILGFLIVYASRYLIRRRKKEFGTYLLLGMSPATVSRIIVYETFFVGVISLGVGLIAGVLLSQGLLYITAAVFTVKMDMFAFMFSWESLIQTVLYFGVIFMVALIFNAATVARYKLIDLINADKKNEDIKLRSLPLSVALFILSVLLIGIAYVLLIKNGLLVFDGVFFASTGLVCTGTLLFFFSLAGFLLRAVQAHKGLYLRGLNLFTLRQLNAKINTTFASITLVCMALFLAITATCGGFALCTAFTQGLESTTTYDASLRVFYGDEDTPPAGSIPWFEQAEADELDMKAALRRDVSAWDNLVKDAVQVDVYNSDTSFQMILDQVDPSEATGWDMADPENNYLSLIPLSSLNNLREMAGMDLINLQSDEYILWCDFEELKDTYQSFLKQEKELTVYGALLHPSGQELETLLIMTSSFASNTGAIVVADEHIPGELPLFYSVLNVRYNGERETVEPLFVNALNDTYSEALLNDSNQMGWPFSSVLTAVQMHDQSVGLSVVIAYLAIYIGLVLLITCAAILALQQLSEAADNARRYSLLQKLGVDERMVGRALLVQIGIYFVFPLIVALCHATVALTVVIDVASMYGQLDITAPLLITVVLFILVYGGYFLLTFFASKALSTGSRSLAS